MQSCEVRTTFAWCACCCLALCLCLSFPVSYLMFKGVLCGCPLFCHLANCFFWFWCLFSKVTCIFFPHTCWFFCFSVAVLYHTYMVWEVVLNKMWYCQLCNRFQIQEVEGRWIKCLQSVKHLKMHFCAYRFLKDCRTSQWTLAFREDLLMSLKINTSSPITLERYCCVKDRFTNYTLLCKFKVIKPVAARTVTLMYLIKVYCLSFHGESL